MMIILSLWKKLPLNLEDFDLFSFDRLVGQSNIKARAEFCCPKNNKIEGPWTDLFPG